MDTYETGGGAAVAQAATRQRARQPRLQGRNRTLGLVHPQPRPEAQTALHADVALGDAVIALTTNHAIEKQTRIEFKPEWFDPARSETPEGNTPRQAAASHLIAR